MRILLILLLISFETASAQNYGSVVISELMIDPTPVIGLPDVEYLELYNRTTTDISLKNWKLTTGARSIALPDSVLPAASYLIICARSALPLLTSYGRCVGISSLSLPNDGATISLYNENNKLQFSINYSSRWWPAEFRDGGYSIEMVDISNYCNEVNNWKVSQNDKGGSPGQTNSVRAPNPDTKVPLTEQLEISTPSLITIRLDERLDSSSVEGAIFELPGRTITSKKLEVPSFDAIHISLNAPLLPEQNYQLTVNNLSDCAGNLSREIKVPFKLPSEPDSGDLVLNEVLFNPRTSGIDFIEIYNASSRYINLNGWKLGTMKGTVPDNLKVITEKDRLLYPFSFLAISIDSKIVEEQYPTQHQRSLLTVNSLPTYPNEKGDVTLVNNQGKLMDHFNYSATYHSSFLDEQKGVSLERLEARRPTNLSTNWQSASATVGYATPGYVNSQDARTLTNSEFTIIPEAFTPDGDGLDDVTTFHYTQSSSGKRADLLIFDSGGRLVKTLLKNQVIGTSGSIQWDGTDDHGKIVRMGYYLVIITTLETNGTVTEYKKRVVVALP